MDGKQTKNYVEKSRGQSLAFDESTGDETDENAPKVRDKKREKIKKSKFQNGRLCLIIHIGAY